MYAKVVYKVNQCIRTHFHLIPKIKDGVPSLEKVSLMFILDVCMKFSHETSAQMLHVMSTSKKTSLSSTSRVWKECSHRMIISGT